MAFNFGDIVAAFTVAQSVYSMGFSKATNANRQYREFGEDVKSLTNNLYVLDEVLKRAQAQSASNITVQEFRGLSNLNNILGNFRQTLNDCEKLLSERSCFQKRDGFVNNIIWNTQVADDVQVLRERVRFHNIKLSTALSTLEIRVVQDLHYRMQDALSQILNRIDELSRQLREGKEEDEVDESNQQSTVPFPFPVEVKEAFSILAQQRYPDLAKLSLAQGLDSVVYYLDRVTKKPLKATQRESRYVSSILNLMKACWLLEVAKSCDEFSTACAYQSKDAFESRMMTWGMTIDKFVQKLEEELTVARGKIRAHRSDFPETPDLLDALSRDQTMWPDESLRIKELEPDKAKLGNEFMSAELHNVDSKVKQTLQLFRQADKYMTMVITNIDISGESGREKWETEGIGLERAHLIPGYALKGPTADRYVLKFKNEEQNPFLKSLYFNNPQQMLRFQHAITGYKVVHDVPDITLTYHQSNIFLGGSSSTHIGRLQIWNAPWPNVNQTSPPSSSKGNMSLLSLQTSLDSLKRRNTGRRVSPILSTASTPTGVLGTGSISAVSDATSATSLGSSEQRNEVSSDNTIQQSPDTRENATIILSPPIPPCLVFFALEQNSPRSFLVIEMDRLTLLNKELCDCHDPKKNCLRTVVEKRGSSLTATKSKDVTNLDDWNIAHAGRYQRKAFLEPIKRLKHLVFGFHSTMERGQFEQRYEQVTKLARIRMNDYLAIK